MPRLTISLPQAMHNRLSSLSVRHNDSLSKIINKLLQVGMYHLDEEQSNESPAVEKHCQQLIIQMNALIKNLSVEVLKCNQNDFEQLRQAAQSKYNELVAFSQKYDEELRR
ncbi:MAG: hypothetical protein Q8R24_09610 [Legionellaceae bacterium]|nr:hypothetical protein [Legionellaceae bacterium]